MGLLTLYSGLLLPWLGGAFWLAFIESQFSDNTQANRFRLTGYGFFLGYAVLFLAIMTSNELTGTVSWPGLMTFLLIFAISGGVAVWKTRSKLHAPPLDTKTPLSKPLRGLAAVILILTTVHLVFMTVEVFTQPLYPWDAWTVWAFRAKAWFLTGGITEMTGSAGWVSATATDVFSTTGWGYPLFPSIITYWAAASLGHWSETLINLPLLLAGLSIGMALYGQCRESGFNVSISLLCCYLLYSIPLFGTHIALAGYADLWMAGFAGLGFVALLRGSIIQDTTFKVNTQLLLGLLMIALGILAKNEGRIWFLAAMAMLIVNRFHLRILLLSFLVFTAVILLAFALGITTIQIPLIGTLGYSGGQFIIPFIGGVSIEVHDIWQPYLKNFFTLGNWNLLWVLVLACLMLSIQSRRHPLQRASLVFIGLFLATQLFIFGFTKQGLWAANFTSINRLPIHFIPALLFSAFLLLRSRFEQLPTEQLANKVQNNDV